jgi:hypothetical protein
MTYCGNSWVSDWTWNKALARIQILTSWEGGDAGPPPPSTALLVGIVSADGHEEWSVHQGVAPTRLDPSERIEFAIDGSIAASVPASVKLLSDDATVMITAPLPVALAEVDAITWLHAERRRSIPVAEVAAGHR